MKPIKQHKMKHPNGLKDIFSNMITKRWLITLLVVITFLSISLGVLLSIHSNTDVVGEWKELLLLMIGALIGSFNKVIDYWFTDNDNTTTLNHKINKEEITTNED